MFGTTDLNLTLTTLAAIRDSEASEDDKAVMIAAVREEFFSRDHPALRDVVDRMTAPKPKPAPEPEAKAEAPRPAKRARA